MSFSVRNVNNDISILEMQIALTQTQNQHISPFNVLTVDIDYSWENLYICPAVSSGITIGFAPPESDNTFDMFKEYDYLHSVGLESGSAPVGYPANSRGINSHVTQSNPRPGNITPFTMYAIIGDGVREFTVSRTVSLDTIVPSVTYIVNPVTVSSDWTAYTITNGSYDPVVPSVLRINA